MQQGRPVKTKLPFASEPARVELTIALVKIKREEFPRGIQEKHDATTASLQGERARERAEARGLCDFTCEFTHVTNC